MFHVQFRDDREWLTCVREDQIAAHDDDTRTLPEATFATFSEAELFLETLRGMMHCGGADTTFRIARTCDNCTEITDTVEDRPHGCAECAPCYLASLEHGRRHIPESFESTYVIVGSTANPYRHVYTDAIEATSRDEALTVAERACAGVRAVDHFTIHYAPLEWTVPALVDRMKAEILVDLASARVPVTVRSFSDLHDYVDANEYGGLCTEACPFQPDSQHDTDIVNKAQGIVDLWLKTRCL